MYIDSEDPFLGPIRAQEGRSECLLGPTAAEAGREAQGLATWWAALHPEVDEAAHAAKASELRAFLASDDPPGDDEDEDDEDLDDAEVFVEVKTAHFIRALGLPTPAGLPG